MLREHSLSSLFPSHAVPGQHSVCCSLQLCVEVQRVSPVLCRLRQLAPTMCGGSFGSCAGTTLPADAQAAGQAAGAARPAVLLLASARMLWYPGEANSPGAGDGCGAAADKVGVVVSLLTATSVL